MQADDTIWQAIDQHFCSFKVTTDDGKKFCRNQFNVTGLCNRQSCPLANSQYATVREIEGTLYLFVKTVERAHLPSKLWERVTLSKNYAQALEQIQQELEYWPEFLQQKCTLRLTRLTQYLRRARQLALEPDPVELSAKKKKIERREKTREVAAEKAARIELQIEKQILHRLKSNVYGEIYNLDQDRFEQQLAEYDKQSESEEEEFVEDYQSCEDENLEQLFPASNQESKLHFGELAEPELELEIEQQ